MSLPISTISQAARSLADYLDEQLKLAIEDTATKVEVKVGSPAQAVPPNNHSNHRVNLFFYLVEPSAFHQDVSVDETWRIRMFCLLTVFGIGEVDPVSGVEVGPGDNDLRLLGEIVRIFHEKPILGPEDMKEVPVRLQIIFHTLTLDELNHLWSTQGDTTLRPSLAYEVGLVPIVPQVKAVEAPRVGQVGAKAVSGTTPPKLPDGSPFRPPVQQFVSISQDQDDWVPQICLVHGKACARALFFELEPSEPLPSIFVWVAGKLGETVTLQWEIYDGSKRWQTVSDQEPDLVPVKYAVIDPAQVSTVDTVNRNLPEAKQTPLTQVMLTPVRKWQRPTGGTVELRGEPVLMTLIWNDDGSAT